MRRSASGAPLQGQWGAALAAAAIVGICSACLMLGGLAPPLHGTILPPGAKLPSSTPAPCKRLPTAAAGLQSFALSPTQPCFEALPHWGVDNWFGWVTGEGPVRVQASWSCLGEGCAQTGPNVVYDDTSDGGSFTFNSSSAGPAFQGNSIQFWIGVESPGNPAGPVPEGTAVVFWTEPAFLG